MIDKPSPNKEELWKSLKSIMYRLVIKLNFPEDSAKAVHMNLEKFFDEEKKLIEKYSNEVVDYELRDWRQRNFDLIRLWKKIAVENAKGNNEPHKVANETVEEFKRQFKVD